MTNTNETADKSTDGTEQEVDPSKLPSEVGESAEINGHKVVLKDPPASLVWKYHCERCGHWFVSGIHFRKPCRVNTGTQQEDQHVDG